MQIPKIQQLPMVLRVPESSPLTWTQQGALYLQGLKG